jgi:hypothetical protein
MHCPIPARMLLFRLSATAYRVLQGLAVNEGR